MKTLLSALVLTTTLTSAALAGGPVTPTGAARPGPVALTEAQMDTITAGGGVGSVDPGSGFHTLYGSGAGSINPGGGGSLTLYGGGVGSIDPGGGGTEEVTLSGTKAGAAPKFDR